MEYETFMCPDSLKILQCVSGNQNYSEGYMTQVSVVVVCLSDMYSPNLTGKSLFHFQQSKYIHQKLWCFSSFIHSSLMRINFCIQLRLLKSSGVKLGFVQGLLSFNKFHLVIIYDCLSCNIY